MGGKERLAKRIISEDRRNNCRLGMGNYLAFFKYFKGSAISLQERKPLLL